MSVSKGTIAIVAAAVCSSVPVPANAQTCWRAQTDCRWTILTESGPRIGRNEAFRDHHLGSVTSIGLLRQRGPTAWGGALQLATSGESGTYQLTIMPRYRRWISSFISVDIGAGIAVLGSGDAAAGFKGSEGFLGMSLGGLMMVTAEVAYRRRDRGSAETAGSIGIRFTGPLGLLAAAVSVAIGLASVGAP
jgi:hypothetical protein